MPAWTRAALALFAVGFGANQFASMLPVYRVEDGASAAEVTILFGTYAAGLIPALLLVAPVSDRLGRRRVLRPVMVLSFVATVVLMVGGHSLALLVLGRLLAGIASGAAFAPGTAWVKELSARPGTGAVPAGTGARRAAVALSAGFGTGPLVTGVLAQWLPAPTLLPYVPHLVLTVVVAALMWTAPEVEADPDVDLSAESRRVGAALRARPFLLGVVPTAPWVFGCASLAFATVPAMVPVPGPSIAVGGALVALTLWTGVLVQPLGKGRPARATIGAGVSAGVLGFAVSIVASATQSGWLVPVAAIGLGAAYGLVLVGGLTVVEEVAAPAELASVTAVFYSLTYVGFAAPFLGTLLLDVVSGTTATIVLTVLLAATAPFVVAAGRDVRARRDRSPR